ncbi:MAG: NAD-binding protein, partial [Actinobacteria bacterium]|nr:NAD-binding protein [Actinomycetota bacterium]
MARPKALAPKVVRKLWLTVGKKLGDELAVGAAILVSFLIISGFVFFFVERGHNENVQSVASGFKWLALTLLTAGSPFDIKTTAGNVIYYFVLISGLGLVAMATGAVASKLVEFVLRRSSGMGQAKVSDHIVICGWSSMGDEILRELHADEVDDKRPVVILANLEASPTRDELTTFVRGNASNGSDLMRAGIDRASTAIVLADDTNPSVGPDERDAKTLLTTLAVESVAPN